MENERLAAKLFWVSHDNMKGFNMKYRQCYIFGICVVSLLAVGFGVLAQQTTGQPPIKLTAQLKELTDQSASIVIRVQNTSTNSLWINKDDLGRENVQFSVSTPVEGDLTSHTWTAHSFIRSHRRASPQPDLLLQPQAGYGNTIVIPLEPALGPPKSFFEQPDVHLWTTIRVRLSEQKEYSRVRLNAPFEKANPSPGDNSDSSPMKAKPMN